MTISLGGSHGKYRVPWDLRKQESSATSTTYASSTCCLSLINVERVEWYENSWTHMKTNLPLTSLSVFLNHLKWWWQRNIKFNSHEFNESTNCDRSWQSDRSRSLIRNRRMWDRKQQTTESKLWITKRSFYELCSFVTKLCSGHACKRERIVNQPAVWRHTLCVCSANMAATIVK